MFGIAKHYADNDYTASLDETIIIASSFMIGVSAIAVALRFLARRVARQQIFLDDWLILLATPFSWFPCIASIVATQYGGYGDHLITSTNEKLEFFLKMMMAYEVSWHTCIMLAKLSILCFYRRIFSVANTKLPAYLIGAVVIGWTVAGIFNVLFSCVPMSAFWDKMAPGGKCLDIMKQLLGFAIPNLIIDLALVAFPLPLIWGTQMPNSKKAAISAIFMVGVLVVIIASLRIVCIFQALGKLDVTWYLVPLDIFNQAESNIAILCACLPSFAPLFRAFIHKKSVQATTASVLAARRRFFTRRWSSGDGKLATTGVEESRDTGESTLQSHTTSNLHKKQLSDEWLASHSNDGQDSPFASRRWDLETKPGYVV